MWSEPWGTDNWIKFKWLIQPISPPQCHFLSPAWPFEAGSGVWICFIASFQCSSSQTSKLHLNGLNYCDALDGCLAERGGSHTWKLTGQRGGLLLAEVRHAVAGQRTVIWSIAVEWFSTFWDDANYFGCAPVFTALKGNILTSRHAGPRTSDMSVREG